MELINSVDVVRKEAGKCDCLHGFQGCRLLEVERGLCMVTYVLPCVNGLRLDSFRGEVRLHYSSPKSWQFTNDMKRFK